MAEETSSANLKVEGAEGKKTGDRRTVGNHPPKAPRHPTLAVTNALCVIGSSAAYWNQRVSTCKISFLSYLNGISYRLGR